MTTDTLETNPTVPCFTRIANILREIYNLGRPYTLQYPWLAEKIVTGPQLVFYEHAEETLRQSMVRCGVHPATARDEAFRFVARVLDSLRRTDRETAGA